MQNIKVDSLPSGELVKAVDVLKSSKLSLSQNIDEIKKSQIKVFGKVNGKVLSLNEDQANKYFKSEDSGMTFSQRIDASLKSLVNASLCNEYCN